MVISVFLTGIVSSTGNTVSNLESVLEAVLVGNVVELSGTLLSLVESQGISLNLIRAQAW